MRARISEENAMKRVWLASAVAAAFWVSASALAAAQSPPGVRIFRIGAMSTPKAASDAEAPAASGPIVMHSEFAPNAETKDVGADETTDAAEAAPAAVTDVSATQAAGEAAAQTLAVPPHAVAAMPAPLARTPDINHVVLQALACSTSADCADTDEKPSAPGSALTASAAGGTPDQEAMAATFRDMMGRMWSEEQQRAIEMIGYYSAAATLCPDAQLSAQDVARVVQENFAATPGVAADAARYRRDALTMHIGMATGLAMGAHLDRVREFCAEAHANRYSFATPLLQEAADTEMAASTADTAQPVVSANVQR
jgi:hypothetical protein